MTDNIQFDPPADLQVDHQNHNGLDNRRQNIRIVTRGENGRNRTDNVKFQSNVDGVSWDSRRNTWPVCIWMNGRLEYDARFRDQAAAEEAARRFRETGERIIPEVPIAEFQSGIKGITWNARACAWEAKVTMNGKRVFLGLFDTVPEAHAALLMYQETGMRVKRPDPRQTAEFHSDVPGMKWNARNKGWVVQPWVNGKRIHLGCFDTEPEAHAALLMYRETGLRVKRAKARKYTL